MADLVSLVLCLGIVVLVFYWLRRPLAHTLDRLVEMTAATELYVRSFAMLLIFSAVAAGVTGLSMPPPPPPPPPPQVAKTSTVAPAAAPAATPAPMQPAAEYVNAITKDLPTLANWVWWDLIWLLGLMTTLAAFLRTRTGAADTWTSKDSASVAAAAGK